MCVLLTIFLPVSLSASDITSAMLRSNGVGVFVNGNAAPLAIAIFRDDLIEIRKDAIARIEITGSSADIGPETVVQFEGDELVLDHGSLAIDSTRGLKVRVGCITIEPVRDAEWTHYEVTDANQKVTVSAVKSDTYINARSGSSKDAKPSADSNRAIVREGEQKTRDEKCGAGYTNPSQDPAGRGAIMNSPWAKWPARAAIAGLACFALCRSDDAISPIHP